MNKQELKAQIREEYRKHRKNGYKVDGWYNYLDHSRKLFDNVIFNSLVSEVIADFDKVKSRLKAYKESQLFRFRIRKYCNYHGYSDIDPNEVVRIISPRKIEIRAMDSVLKASPTAHLGGFLAHTENDTQKWECVSNPNNPVETITLTKKGWGQGRFRMNDNPVKFYDYNF